MKIFKRLKLELKNLRGFYWLPVTGLLILLPIIAQVYVRSSGVYEAYYLTIETAQWMNLLMAPLWNILLMRPFFHFNGKELFLLCNDRYDNLLLRTLCMTGWYLVHTLLFMAFCFCFFKQNVLPFWALIAAQALFINGLCYLLAIFCRNTFIPVIFTVSYCVIFGLMVWVSDLSVFMMNGAFVAEPALIVQKVLTALIAAGLFFAAGAPLERGLYK